MRTKALLCAAGILAAGAATSMAQNVYSLNVVGYVTKTVPQAGKYVLLANPLTTANNTIGGLIDTNPATGLKWNGTSFNSYKRVAFSPGWTPSTAPTVSLNPGEGFFIQSPPASTTDITNVFIGEALQSFSANSAGSMSNYLAAGYNLLGSQVAVSNNIAALGLVIPFSSSPQNQVLKWSVAGQTYNPFKRLSFGWTPAEPGVDVGEGFFAQVAAPQSWVQNFTVQ